jgi:peptidase M28-like protein
VDRLNSSEHAFEEMISYINTRVWQDSEAWELMKILCGRIGPRPAGSPAMSQARIYLGSMWEALGAVNVREEEVPVRLWDPGAPKIELLEPELKSYDCLQHLFTASEDLILPLVDARDGIPTGCGRSGKRVAMLMNGREISGGKFTPFITRITQACEQGAGAIIIRNMDPTGLPVLEVPDLRKDGSVPVPCISVSGEAADELARASLSLGRIRVKTDGSSCPGACANLIADLGPAEIPQETIMLGAHLDSHWNAPGAFDNLTGVATVFEIARLLAPFRSSFRRTLRFVAYTGEELGFRGSRSYVSRHRQELDKVSLVVNMDGIFTATARGMAVMWSPKMRDHIARAFGKAGRQVDVRNHFCCSSDYLPFMLEGIPTARPADWEDSFPLGSHTEGDGLSNVRVDWIQLNAMVYAQLLAQMLTDPNPLPVKRFSVDEIRERLRQENMIQNLGLMGFEL